MEKKPEITNIPIDIPEIKYLFENFDSVNTKRNSEINTATNETIDKILIFVYAM
jgi:hypothetical protein